MIHHFSPTHYHINIGSHEPVLHVADGDTIVTTSVDARGYDHTRTQITPPGNPQTGPFFIDGAEPGDTLVVHIDSLAPNRPIGWTGRYLAPNVLDPDYGRTIAETLVDAKTLCEWEMDLERWTACLINPSDTRLGRFTLPLAPMLGCFGVAPPVRTGDLVCHLLDPWWQHGLSGVHDWNDGVFPGVCSRSTAACWRRPRGPR